jgi:hypothetical protein
VRVARRERRIVLVAVRMPALDPLLVRVLGSGAVEATLVIEVSHRVRVSVRAATRLAAAALAAALRDRPAVEEATAWAVVALAVAVVAGVAVDGVAVEAGDKQWRERDMNRIPKQIAKTT